MKRLFLLLLVFFCPGLFALGQSFGDPIVIDIDGKGFDSAFTDIQHGVTFDFFGPGKPAEMAWTEPGRNIGFLVLNRYGDQIPTQDGSSNARLWFTTLARWKQQGAAGKAPDDRPAFHVYSSQEMFGGLTNQPLSE